MVAVVSHEDTATFPASAVNSLANSLVPVSAAPANPLESALTNPLASAHSKRLTKNLTPAESALAKNRGILPSPFVTRITPICEGPTPPLTDRC